ncbi:MFS transporter [Microbacterium oleivorans]|uniref:MFS transporter n=1 Tax=Microbacterium oleivorans TaxID=273677 RepID=UPI0021163EE7|nr:MFS transporter [Microbacterium oleivorans]
MSELAVPLLAVVSLGASAGQAGMLGAARWVPFLLLALPLGVLVDRMRRRPILIAADLARAALTVVIVLLASLGRLTLPALLFFVLLLGAFTVAFEVSYQSYLPTVAGRDQLERANGRLQATAAAAEIGGPGLGGVLIQTLTAAWALLAHAVTYVVSAVALIGIGARERRPTPTGHGALAELREGLRFVRRDRYLVALVGFAAIYNLFAHAITVLFTVHAVRELGLEAGHLGLVFGLGAVGAVAAAANAPGAVRRFGAGRVLVACAAVESVALSALPVIPAGLPLPALIAVLVGVFACNGAGTALSSVVALTLRQLRTPDALLGRVNATMRWISYGVIALGAGLGGIAGELLGTRAGMAIGCGGVLLTVVWVALSPLRTIRDPRELAASEGGDRAGGGPDPGPPPCGDAVRDDATGTVNA